MDNREPESGRFLCDTRRKRVQAYKKAGGCQIELTKGQKLPKEVLRPLELLYRVGLYSWYLLWKFRSRQVLEVPVLSLGNLTVGGTGKTPLTIFLAREFINKGLSPLILTRGYRRKKRGMLLLKDEEVSAELAGDEAALIVRKLRGKLAVLVEKDRLKAARWAKEHIKPDLMILDDGHQYLPILPKVSLVLLTPESFHGPPHLLPRGPFREVPAALERGDALVVNLKLTKEKPGLPAWVKEHRKGPIFWMRYRIAGLVGGGGQLVDLEDIRGEKVFAFAGIADPESFFNSLRSLEIELVGSKRFPDHHYYSKREISSLLESAKRLGAPYVLTTEKDLVRLQAIPPEILALQVEVVVEEKEKFLEWLEERLFSRSHNGNEPQG